MSKDRLPSSLRAGSEAKVSDGCHAFDRPLSVLLADDYEANRMMQQAQVEQLGYQIDAVANGEEVLRALHVRDYDVVLLDIRMPIMNGLECATRIRARTRETQPFIVAVTSGTSSQERAQIRKAGIDAYIAKPVELGELAGVLREAYEQKLGDPGELEDTTTVEPVELELGHLHDRLGSVADQLLRRVIPAYLRELPEREARMRKALGAQDAEAVAQLCHGLKGASRVVGATELAAICDQLEQNAYAGTLPDTIKADQLLDLARRTARELRNRLAVLETRGGAGPVSAQSRSCGNAAAAPSRDRY
ncbi:MAG: response regulator [Gammaproteobacteria bacterium]|nr:response regulator [Gammaproteobacteria bacterium]